MHLILDNNVPDSVGEKFKARGHHVEYVREILAANAPDQLIAALCDQEGAVLVTGDRDFRQIAARIPRGQKTRFRRLSRISLQCSEPQAAQRVEEAMTLIESEYEIAQKQSDKRIFIVIQTSGIKTHR